MPTPTPAPRFPEILAELREGDGLRLDLRISESLTYFRGHFPQVPVLAGVVQIHWAVHFAQARFPAARRFHHMEVIKFKDLIVPGRDVSLHLDFDGATGRLKFAYRGRDHEFSSGRIYFAER